MFSIHDTKNIKVINSNFRENEAYDDTIHIVYSKNILFEGVKVDKVYSDAIDVDISSNITFKNIEIKNSINDGLDFMESNAVVENSKIYRSNDKGISIGEGSMVSVKNSHLKIIILE